MYIYIYIYIYVCVCMNFILIQETKKRLIAGVYNLIISHFPLDLFFFSFYEVLVGLACDIGWYENKCSKRC